MSEPQERYKQQSPHCLADCGHQVHEVMLTVCTNQLCYQLNLRGKLAQASTSQLCVGRETQVRQAWLGMAASLRINSSPCFFSSGADGLPRADLSHSDAKSRRGQIWMQRHISSLCLGHSTYLPWNNASHMARPKVQDWKIHNKATARRWMDFPSTGGEE